MFLFFIHTVERLPVACGKSVSAEWVNMKLKGHFMLAQRPCVKHTVHNRHAGVFGGVPDKGGRSCILNVALAGEIFRFFGGNILLAEQIVYIE